MALGLKPCFFFVGGTRPLMGRSSTSEPWAWLRGKVSSEGSFYEGCGSPLMTLTVSRAISSSSSVGMAYASSFEASVLIIPS